MAESRPVVAQVVARSEGTHTREEGSDIELSVILALYNEAGVLPMLVPQLTQVLDTLKISYEVIFVSDGSTDGSAPYLREACARHERIKLLELSRNFGHHVALSAGLDHAAGRKVVLMDADLQDDPQLIPEFLARAREGYQVVYARRYQRREGRMKRWMARAYHRLLQRVSSITMPLDAGIFCLLDRQVMDVLRSCGERHRYLNGLRAWAGFRQYGLDVVRSDRPEVAGPPKYSFMKLLGLSLEGLFSFSYVPLRLATWCGVLFLLGAFVIAGFLAYRRLTASSWVVPGWTSLLSVVLLLGGVQLMVLGILGEYLGRIYDEVKRRPLYVVAAKTGFER